MTSSQTLQCGWLGQALRTLNHQRRHLLGLLLPWLLLTLVGVPMLWSETEKAMQGATSRARDAVSDEVRQVFVRTLDLLRHDIIFLAEMPGALMLNDAAPGSAAGRLFESFARSNRNYDKVRWIDETGHERLRIDQRDGIVRVTSPDGLQDESGRPFFIETVGLAKGATYFSPIDLNVERGQIEDPPRPTLRVVAPVFDLDGRRGIVVVNYRVAALIDRVRDIAATQGFELYLLNDDGYWIRGPVAGDDWAWQRGAPQKRASNTHTALWNEVSRGGQGVWSDASGDWAYTDLAALQRIGDPDSSGAPAKRLGLRVLVHAPYAAAKDPGWRVRIAVGAVALLLVIGGSAFVWRLASSLEAEAQRAAELERLNRALRDAGRNLDAMQSELARVARLSSLGLMVAGVAHEMNSPLGSVMLALSSAQHGLAELTGRMTTGLRRSDLERLLGESQDALRLAADQTRRASGIVQRFKQVAVDRTTLERRRFDLAETIADADPMLSARAAEQSVAVRLDLAPDLTMEGYPGPLAQVVSNLVINAMLHGFDGGGSGLISVSARSAGAHEVVIVVRDNGKGIEKGALPHVFEPFFTTGRGKGSTGLGLHIVHQLISEVLGGSIWIDSVSRVEQPHASRHGTTVTVRLPRVAPAVDPSVSPAVNVPASNSVIRSGI